MKDYAMEGLLWSWIVYVLGKNWSVSGEGNMGVVATVDGAEEV